MIRRRGWWIVGVAALLLGGWWLSRSLGSEASAETVAVERNDLVLSVEVNGTLRAQESSQLGPPPVAMVWEFKIAHMAPEGEEVQEGAAVLSFDTSQLQQRLAQYRADLDKAGKEIERTEADLEMTRRENALRMTEARAKLSRVELKLDRPQELVEGQELQVARLDHELAVREVDFLGQRVAGAERSAEAQLEALVRQRARAVQRVELVEQAIEQMTRRAPRNGTVIYVTDWQGEKKKVGDGAWRGERVIELPDLETMQAQGVVDESDVGKIAEGQLVTLRLDAHPDAEFSGKIQSIWRTVERRHWSSSLKVAKLEIELDETDVRRMRPGMRFRGHIETERLHDVLQIPIEAVEASERGPVVYLPGLGGPQAVRVELGRRNETHVEVLDGLQAGDRVVRLASGGRA